MAIPHKKETAHAWTEPHPDWLVNRTSTIHIDLGPPSPPVALRFETGDTWIESEFGKGSILFFITTTSRISEYLSPPWHRCQQRCSTNKAPTFFVGTLGDRMGMANRLSEVVQECGLDETDCVP